MFNIAKKYNLKMNVKELKPRKALNKAFLKVKPNRIDIEGFKTHLKAATPDLFGVVCLKGADTMITDATEPRIVQRLPAWYPQSLNAPTFLLLPLQIKNAPFGLIYADKVRHGSLELDEKELALLRTLRNQAVMAFKQSS